MSILSELGHLAVLINFLVCSFLPIEREGKLGSYGMKRVVAGAHLQSGGKTYIVLRWMEGV